MQTNDHNVWHLYKEIQNENELPIRVFLTPDCKEIGSDSIPSPGSQEGLLQCHRVKLFADGSLGAETAALISPYVGTENMGVLMMKDDEMLQSIQTAHTSGYRIEVHAIE